MNGAIFLAALLSTVDAAAQPQAAAQGPVEKAILLLSCRPSSPAGDSGADKPPAPGDCVRPAAELSRPPAHPSPFIWQGSVSGLAPGDETSPWLGNDGQPWNVASGVTYSTRGVTFGVGVQGHHGYHISPAGALGEMTSLVVPQASFADVTGSRSLDARLMVKRRLYRSRRGTSFDAVVEALLPLAHDGADGRPSDSDVAPKLPASFAPIRSRSLRFGLVISFD